MVDDERLMTAVLVVRGRNGCLGLGFGSLTDKLISRLKTQSPKTKPKQFKEMSKVALLAVLSA